MGSIKKVLIIADLGHASPRIPCFCAFLPNYGWEPIIITPEMDKSQKERFLINKGKGLIILETPGYKMAYRLDKKKIVIRGIRKIWNIVNKARLGWRYQYPDTHTKWEKHVLQVAEKVITENPIDLLFSSSSPVSAHVIAKRISKEFQIPWIADLRDLWTQNHNYQFGASRFQAERDLELKTIQQAVLLTTVTPQLQIKLANFHNKKTFFVPNGFYKRENKRRNLDSNSNIIKIVYTGQIYSKHQDVLKVVNSINRLLIERKIDEEEITLNMYGDSSNQLSMLYRQRRGSIPMFIRCCGSISREESYKVQEEAQILLFLNWEDPEEKGVATTKLYEYLSVGIPILATGGHGNDYIEDILNKTGAGKYCKSEKEIKNQILYWIRELKTHGTIAQKRNEQVINHFSYDSISGRLANIYDLAIKKNNRND